MAIVSPFTKKSKRKLSYSKVEKSFVFVTKAAFLCLVFFMGMQTGISSLPKTDCSPTSSQWSLDENEVDRQVELAGELEIEFCSDLNGTIALFLTFFL